MSRDDVPVVDAETGLVRDGEFVELAFADADWDHSADRMPRPWLVFHPKTGLFAISDDYEWPNDEFARTMKLRKTDAVKLALGLLAYAQGIGASEGVTPAVLDQVNPPLGV